MRSLAIAVVGVIATISIASAAPARDITPRKALPDAIRDHVPKHGIYVVGGGLTSAAWRVVVDYDAKTIYSGTTPTSGAPANGKHANETTKPLADDARKHLAELAEAAWREPSPTTPSQPTADYDELLVIADGDDTFELDGFGPIRRPAAAKLIAALRTAAGM